MNVIKHRQFVELDPSAPTQTEVTPAHAWQGLKWLMEAAWVCSVYSTNFFSIIYTYLFTAMFSTVKLELQKVQHFTVSSPHLISPYCYFSLMHLITEFSLFFTDINECDDNDGGCTSNSNCVNILGSFECQCQRGYEMMEGECRGK